MSGEEERLEKLAREVEETRKEVLLKIAKLSDIMLLMQATLAHILSGVVLLIKNDYICADPHGTWDGHLPGAYDEGDQVKATLESKGHSVTMNRHPVTKADFLNNLPNKFIVHLCGHGDCSGGVVRFCFDDADVYPADISLMSSVPTWLFYAGVCKGGCNDSMASVFRAKGTKKYVGFTKNIPDWGAKWFDDMVFEKWLVDGKELRVALDESDDYYPELNCWVLWE